MRFLKYFCFFPGYNKTFTVSLERTESHQLKEVAFMNLGRLLVLLSCVIAILCVVGRQMANSSVEVSDFFSLTLGSSVILLLFFCLPFVFGI